MPSKKDKKASAPLRTRRKGPACNDCYIQHQPCTPTDANDIHSICERCERLEIECNYTRDLKKRGPTKGLSDANNLALAFLCVEVPGCVEALAKILQNEEACATICGNGEGSKKLADAWARHPVRQTLLDAIAQEKAKEKAKIEAGGVAATALEEVSGFEADESRLDEEENLLKEEAAPEMPWIPIDPALE